MAQKFPFSLSGLMQIILTNFEQKREFDESRSNRNQAFLLLPSRPVLSLPADRPNVDSTSGTWRSSSMYALDHYAAMCCPGSTTTPRSSPSLPPPPPSPHAGERLPRGALLRRCPRAEAAHGLGPGKTIRPAS